MLEVVRNRLEQMLTQPDERWGKAEAYELQVLLLIELEGILRGVLDKEESQRKLVDNYTKFNQRVIPLSAETRDLAEIADHLTRFRLSMWV